MSALGDPWHCHQFQGLHAYGTFHIIRIYHMIYHLHNILPVHRLIGVIQIHQVVLLPLHYKLQLRLHQLLLANMLEYIALILLPPPPPILVPTPLAPVVCRAGSFLLLVLET